MTLRLVLLAVGLYLFVQSDKAKNVGDTDKSNCLGGSATLIFLCVYMLNMMS